MPNIQLRYQSRSGNTKKVAQAMAQALNISADTIDNPLDGIVDLLFLGGAVYAGGMEPSLVSFLQTFNPVSIKKVAVFSTSAKSAGLYDSVSELLIPLGLTLCPDAFHCKGKFLLFNRDRPNEQDLRAAADYARRIVSETTLS